MCLDSVCVCVYLGEEPKDVSCLSLSFVFSFSFNSRSPSEVVTRGGWGNITFPDDIKKTHERRRQFVNVSAFMKQKETASLFFLYFFSFFLQRRKVWGREPSGPFSKKRSCAVKSVLEN